MSVKYQMRGGHDGVTNKRGRIVTTRLPVIVSEYFYRKKLKMTWEKTKKWKNYIYSIPFLTYQNCDQELTWGVADD